MSDEINTTANTDEQSPVVLSVNDIDNAVKIIDYAADQGAFKGWKTVEQVLLVRKRLTNFLDIAAAAQAQADGNATTDAETVVSDAPATDAN
jgi:hypothetical protein